MMIRSFLPVGQGAFYRESFNVYGRKFNIVYDCGTSTDVKIINNKIDNEFEVGEDIEAVFISHLDNDHINGIEFLLKHCKVKNLFFPLVTSEDKVYLKLKHLLTHSNDDFAYKFIDNPKEAFSEINLDYTPSLHQVTYTDKDNEYIFNGIDAQRIPSGENVARYVFSDAQSIYKTNWKLIPFNFRQDERVKQLNSALQEEFTDYNSMDELLNHLLDNYEKNMEKIKSAFKKVKGDFNTNSMTLFSGVCDDYYRQSKCVINKGCCTICGCPDCRGFIKPNGCLYLGDYDTRGKQKWEELYEAYNEYWKYIGCVQIPHHGSRHNYHKELSKINAYYIISAGYKNKYQHPHSVVIKDLFFNNCDVNIVTEFQGSQVDIMCDWYR